MSCYRQQAHTGSARGRSCCCARCLSAWVRQGRHALVCVRVHTQSCVCCLCASVLTHTHAHSVTQLTTLTLDQHTRVHDPRSTHTHTHAPSYGSYSFPPEGICNPPGNPPAPDSPPIPGRFRVGGPKPGACRSVRISGWLGWLVLGCWRGSACTGSGAGGAAAGSCFRLLKRPMVCVGVVWCVLWVWVCSQFSWALLTTTHLVWVGVCCALSLFGS